jgi:hypothetical protein
LGASATVPRGFGRPTLDVMAPATRNPATELMLDLMQIKTGDHEIKLLHLLSRLQMAPGD